MSKLTIIAHITAKPDKVELVKSELLKLIPTTRAEAGCIDYDLHQDREDPTRFLFFENWETRELWLDHSEAQHIKDFLAATEGSVENFAIQEMDFIG